MPHYLYRIEPTRIEMLSEGPTEAEAAAIGDHFDYLQRKADDGSLFMAGRTLVADRRAFGIVVFAAASDAEAQAVLDHDPAVVRGVMRGQVFPFRVALWAGDPMGEGGDG